MMHGKNFLFGRFCRNILLVSLLFCCACSTKKYKADDWCEDVFIPGNKYYATNIRHQQGFEIPPVLNAKEILPPEMQGNSLFKVKNNVYSDGTIDHFYVTSKWGDSMAAGFLILKTRINEVNALESLDKVEEAPFLEGFGKSVWGIITAPWSLIKLIGHAFSGGEKKTAEEIEEEEELKAIKKEHLEQRKEGKEEVDDSELVNERLQKILDDDKDFVQHIPYNNEETADVNTVQSLIGVRDNVVEILEKFHIDPDNTNPLLGEKILHIAEMKSFGELSTAIIPTGKVLSIMSSTKSVVGAVDSMSTNTISVYSTKKEQKEKIRDGLLLAGCSDKLIDRFENAQGFSTFLKVIIANNVIRMRKVKNVNELIKMAIMVDDYEIGWMLMQSFAILPVIFEEEYFDRFIKDSPLPTVVTKDNRVIMTFAGDHLYWVRDTSMFFNEALDAIREDGVRPRSIEARVKGIPSERFKRELAALGIRYVPVNNVKYQIKLYNDQY